MALDGMVTLLSGTSPIPIQSIMVKSTVGLSSNLRSSELCSPSGGSRRHSRINLKSGVALNICHVNDACKRNFLKLGIILSFYVLSVPSRLIRSASTRSRVCKQLADLANKKI